VAWCLYSPLSGDNWGGDIFLEGRPAPGPMDDNEAWFDWASAGYFDTVGHPIVKGRPISEQDIATSRNVALISETFARKFFKGEDPIGKRFGTTAKAAGKYEVVGVAKDARYLTRNLQQPLDAFVILAESPSVSMRDIVVRMQPGAKLSEAQVRYTLAGIDPDLPIVRMQSLSEQVAGNFNQPRLIAQLTSLFGILALVLASIGIYGVTAYNAGSRTNEIGVRMALGADRGDILALILRGALILISFGLLLGVPLTLATARFLGSQLYGIKQYDPMILGAAILTLGSSALIAALIPALRASSILPLQALRAD
jgi:predicted permease